MDGRSGSCPTAIKLSAQAGCGTQCRWVDKQSASTHRAHRAQHPCHVTQKLAGCAALLGRTTYAKPLQRRLRKSYGDSSGGQLTQHFLGQFARLWGDVDTADHAGEFVDACGGGERVDDGAGAAGIVLFLHVEVVLALGGDLG